MPTQNRTYRFTAPATPLAALYSLHPKPYTLKNFTFSAKERDVETGLSYFGSRYYSSDLSIWLSVDPQAAKYPGLSPFTYCADNPVKLVDPNGEQWETPEDEEKANKMIYTAQQQQNGLAPNSTKYKMLQEGIDGLKAMGAEEGQNYGFKESSYGYGCITKDNGTIYMNYFVSESFPEQEDASAWHEAIHLTRYNKWEKVGDKESLTQFSWKSKENGVSILAFNRNRCFEETYTTYSTMLYSPNSVRFFNGTHATDIQSVKQYMLINDKYMDCSLDGFKLSDGVNEIWLRR